MNELIGFTSDALRSELHRRAQANREGKCDACGAWYDEPACQNLRHGDAGDEWIGRWQLDVGSTWLSATIDRPDIASITISRYAVGVTLFRYSSSHALTILPDDSMSDRERFEWAIRWADDELRKIDGAS